jgi:hypothetical protein
MQHEVSHVKWAHLLSQNQIQEIVMDSDSNEENYYSSEDMEDEGEPRPQFFKNSNDRPLSQRLVTEVEMLVFLALPLQMEHTVQGRLEDY